MQILYSSNNAAFHDAFFNAADQLVVVADVATPSLITLRNPETGLRMEMTGRAFSAFSATSLFGTVDGLVIRSANGTPLLQVSEMGWGLAETVNAVSGLSVGVNTEWMRQTLIRESAVTLDASAATEALDMLRLLGTPSQTVFATFDVRGTAQADWLYGLVMDDTLSGGAGDDTLAGGDGDDLLYGGAGADSLLGADGADLIGAGAGNDTAAGGAGHDTIYGAAGDDLLQGDAGNDLIGGAAGNDTLFGGDGDDALWTSLGDDRAFGGNGHDTIGGAAGNDSLSGEAGQDELWGAAGNDTLLGGAGDDQLGGGADHDVIDGGTGDDLLFGGTGDDSLTGGTGDDQLFGAAGRDTLTGGAGNDTIYGGPGADVFVFGTGDGADRISFFSAAEDRLQLDDALWSGTLSAVQVVAQFGAVQGNDYVLEFGNGDVLTLVGRATQAGLLETAIDIA